MLEKLGQLLSNPIQFGIDAAEKLKGLIPGIDNYQDVTQEFMSSIDLVSPIIEGLVTWVHDLLSNSFINLITLFVDSYDANSPAFYHLLGIFGDKPWDNAIFSPFYLIGGLLLVFIFIFSIMIINMGPLTDQKNNLLELIVRFFISLGLICVIKPFLALLNDLSCYVHALMNYDLSSIFSSAGSNIFSGLSADHFSNLGTNANLFVMIIQIVCWIAIIIEFIKFMLEVLERYVVVQILHVTSPTVASFYVSRTTSSILSNFMRMYISQLFLLLMNTLYLYIASIMIVNVFCTSTDFKNLFLIIVVLKCAQRIDSYMKSLGLSVAQTGGALLGSLMGAAVAMGGAIAGLKRGATMTGSALEAAGARVGDFGMASLGTKMKARANGDFSNVQSKALGSFATGGGFANLDRNSTKQLSNAVNAASDMLRSGQFNAFSQIPHDIQSQALKSAIAGPNGDLLEKATAGVLTKGDITSVSMDRFGTITGSFTNGQGVSGQFALSTTDFSSGILVSGLGDNTTRGLSLETTSLPDSYSCEWDAKNDGVTPMEMVYGTTFPKDEFAKYDGNIKADVVNDVATYTNEGKTIGFQNVNNGEYYGVGTCEDFLKDAQSFIMNSSNGLNQYMPSDASFVPGMCNTKDGVFKGQITSYESGEGVLYDVLVEPGAQKHLQANVGGHLCNTDQGVMYIKCTRSNKKPSGIVIS